MAGTLPGVGVGFRRMHHHHPCRHRQDDPLVYPEPSARERLQQYTTANMDETALRARQRLERKLAGFRASSRSSKGGGESRIRSSRSNSIGSRILGRSWKMEGKSGRSESGTCCVCLEELKGEEEMMELSCSHRYHSKCLKPWLASHPHCPYCRNPVQF